MYELRVWAAITEKGFSGLWRSERVWKSDIFVGKYSFLGDINKMENLVCVITSICTPKKVEKNPSYQVIFASEYWVSLKTSSFSGTKRNSLCSIDSENSDLFLKLLFSRLHRQSPASCPFWGFFWGLSVLFGSQKSPFFSRT